MELAKKSEEVIIIYDGGRNRTVMPNLEFAKSTAERWGAEKCTIQVTTLYGVKSE